MRDFLFIPLHTKCNAEYCQQKNGRQTYPVTNTDAMLEDSLECFMADPTVNSPYEIALNGEASVIEMFVLFENRQTSPIHR